MDTRLHNINNIPFILNSYFFSFFFFVRTYVVVALFFFYFIFKLYIIVLVLPNIKMNPPQVYMCIILNNFLNDKFLNESKY